MARILVADDDNRVRAAITKDLVAAATVLPRLGGRHPAEALRRDAQPVPVLFTSGYSSSDVVESLGFDPELPFLHKPGPSRTY